MRILIATDAFPPNAGGSGWSTYELARGLRMRGHHVGLVRTYSETDPRPEAYDGFAVDGFPAFAPPVPFLRNYVRNERLYQRLGRYLARVIKDENIDLVHGQHVLTGPASIIAARIAGVPSVCTVRDYWPICYWGDILANPGSGALCPGCSASAMTRCLRPRTGVAWPATLPLIPYMRGNLRRKQASLADADVVVAVSGYVAEALRKREPQLGRARIEVIPNGVDIASIRADSGMSSRPMSERYALFAGKLAKNKGAHMLVDIVERARLDLPLVVVGDGPERGFLEQAARAARRDIRFVGWQDRRVVFRWLRHADVLLFPSIWPEPLSRVLIEASALGVPIAAIESGGTADIVEDGETGLLSTSATGLADAVARLASDGELRARLGRAAAHRAATHFDMAVVIGRMEALYQKVIAARRQQHAIA
jgi:glycosyltransferase involved in cell wall biosynthesis